MTSLPKGAGEASSAPALRVGGIEKFFGATHALRGVDLSLDRFEVHGLVGENGCGKSTLVKVMAGIHHADKGWIEAAGTRVEAGDVSPATARQMGVTVVHQEAPSFASLSIEENLALGHRYPTRRGHIDRAAVRREAEEVIERYEIPAAPQTPARELSPAVRAMLAIARALRDSRRREDGVLILDEPTAGLSEVEAEDLLEAVRRYARGGQAVMLVSHRLDEIVGACRRVTVMRDGAVVATIAEEKIDRPSLVSLMVGDDLAEEYRADRARAAVARDPAPAVLALRDVAGATLGGVSLEVRKGEIVGLAGQLGSGCSEALQVAYGAAPFLSGEVLVAGRVLQPGRPLRVLSDLVGYVPADRSGEATFGGMSVRENLGVAEGSRYWRTGWFRRRSEERDSASLIEEFKIRPADPEARMATLSGGIQQKVVMARAMRRARGLLLLDEPSQGVDVGARADIHHSIRRIADGGAGVLVVSSDMEELARLCDRVLAFVGGRIVGELTGERLDRVALSNLIHRRRGDAPGAERTAEMAR